jgi:hypothetical protein
VSFNALVKAKITGECLMLVSKHQKSLSKLMRYESGSLLFILCKHQGVSPLTMEYSFRLAIFVKLSFGVCAPEIAAASFFVFLGKKDISIRDGRRSRDGTHITKCVCPVRLFIKFVADEIKAPV